MRHDNSMSQMAYIAISTTDGRKLEKIGRDDIPVKSQQGIYFNRPLVNGSDVSIEQLYGKNARQEYSHQ